MDSKVEEDVPEEDATQSPHCTTGSSIDFKSKKVSHHPRAPFAAQASTKTVNDAATASPSCAPLLAVVLTTVYIVIGVEC